MKTEAIFNGDPSVQPTSDVVLSNFLYPSETNLVSGKIYKQARLKENQELVLRAVDPEPSWISTQASAPMIVAEANGNYSINLTKLDVKGSPLGLVDKSKLRFELRVQHDETTIEFVPEENHSAYVNWDANQAGRINVHVPANLTRGRLIIGVRPNLGDDAQNAIAERWGALILVDIWPLQPNVTSVELKDVYYPIDDKKGMRAGSAFNLQSISTAADQAMLETIFKDQAFKPLVVKGLNLQVGQLIDYRISDATGGKYPYGGRVLKVINGSDGQQLVFVGFNYGEVYIIDFANLQTTLVEEGVLPEFVSYRSSDMDVLSATNRVSVDYKSQNQAVIQATGQNDWFDKSCKDKATSKVVFTPSFDLDKLEASIDYLFELKGAEISCKIFTKPNAAYSIPLPGIFSALKYLVGTGIEVGPFGEINITGKFASDLVSFKLTGTASTAASKPPTLKFGSDGKLGAGLDAPREKAELQGAGKLGLYLKGSAVKLTIPVFGDIDFSLTGKVNAALAIKALGVNPAAANGGETSQITASLVPEASLEASETINSYLQSIGLKKLKFPAKINDGISFPLCKASYKIDQTYDSGQGVASISLLPENKFLGELFGNGSTVNGYLNLMSSTVYNDRNSSIDYDTNECRDKGGEIRSQVVGCIGDFFCGRVIDKAVLCKETDFPDNCNYRPYNHDWGYVSDSAQHCIFPLTKPAERYTVSPDKQFATDIVTGLTWSRCLVGERYSNGQCVGLAKGFNYNDAMAAGSVPTALQLLTLVEGSCFHMAMNEFIFPRPKDYLLFQWSSTLTKHPDFPNFGYTFGTTYGNAACHPRVTNHGLRQVK